MTASAAERKALSMDLMNEAISEFRRRMRHYVGGTIFFSLPTVAIGGVMAYLWFTRELTSGEWQRYWAVLGVVFIAAFNQFLFGTCRSALKSLKGEEPAFRDFFGHPRIALGEVLTTTLVTALGLILGLAACLVGGLVIASLFFLALPAATSGEMSGVQALRWSWTTLRRQFGAAFAICNTVHLVAVSGILVLGIGGLFTLAIYPISQAILFHRLRQNDAAGELLSSSPM